MIKRLPKVFESGNKRKIIIINFKSTIKKVVKSVLNDIFLSKCKRRRFEIHDKSIACYPSKPVFR